MATSGSTDYTLVTNTIIDEAFAILAVKSEGVSISAYQYEDARTSLNLMIKTWGISDHLFTRKETTQALTGSTASYALAVKAQRIEEVRIRDSSNNDTTLTEWTMQQYKEQANKTTTGPPTAWYYDPQNTTGTLYLWPTPSTADASEYTVYFTYLRVIEDFDTSADSADFPQEWLETLCYGLAARLAFKYVSDPQRRLEIRAAAKEMKAELDSWDTETGSLFLQPAYD